MAYKKWLSAGTVVALVAALAVFHFQQALADGRAMILPVDPTPLVAVTAGGERAFNIEIADDAAKRSAGLMFRQDMADDHGMLFIFAKPQTVTFWMKNTPMPLDLIFIDQDGRVESIKQGEPQSEAAIPSDGLVRFVLELKAGMAAKDNIRAGDLVKHPAIGDPSVGNGG